MRPLRRRSDANDSQWALEPVGITADDPPVEPRSNCGRNPAELQPPTVAMLAAAMQSNFDRNRAKIRLRSDWTPGSIKQ